MDNITNITLNKEVFHIQKYEIQINDRKYREWNVVNENDRTVILPGLCPIKMKLFHGDTFLYDPSHSTTPCPIHILSSNIRSKSQYPGVLRMDKMVKRQGDKEYYKCIPDDPHLPIFLVPYKYKLGFSKNSVDKYVLFQFDQWLYDHPYAKLTNTLGNIDDLSVYYDYQLYCRNLHIPIKVFTNRTKECIEMPLPPESSADKKNIDPIENIIQSIKENPKYGIENRELSHKVFSIDPRGSLDFDDAFSIRHNSYTGQIEMTIYIANVYIWLENLNLWDFFSKRVSTIYLPDRKLPMLPPVLSDCLCSLQEKTTRFAFTLDIILCDMDGSLRVVGEPKFSNTSVVLYKNYVYDEPELLCDPHYRDLSQISKRLDPSIADSHDVVAYWMLYMNQICGKQMASEKIGIFRSVRYTPPEIRYPIGHIKDETLRMMKQWGNTIGEYVKYHEDMAGHQIMDIASYIHITSPIRRLVDLLNQITILDTYSLIKGDITIECRRFLDHWTTTNQITYINHSMRQIRKIQQECELLHRCSSHPELLEREHKGILFGKMEKKGFYHYVVYLEDINILSKVVIQEDLCEYTYMTFRLFLFQGEDKIKRKIRVSICHQY